ncbi:hypothetical protein [Rhizobium sp. BK176]|uniref:hypothetical protein n=1 Tax=Rhizobium sp. BK176 TaxID=2587071 RepID=UPI0021685513|nr:hypothetical protein [Rhizobium sp. BK176]MCS4088472.1 hypothetical protein [Rhizobium sp. BK176]
MTDAPASNLIDVLKNIVIACEANGLRDLPFVVDGRRAIDSRTSDPISELIKELREAADLEEEAHVEQDHYHAELLYKAANVLDTLAMPAKQVGWETEAEHTMEQQMFHACGRDDVPKDVQKLVGQLWKQYCLAAAPKEPDLTEAGPTLTDAQVDLARAIYLSKVKEYDRDFERDDKPEGFWQEKYGTNLHATSLGEQWAMRQALNAVLADIGLVVADGSKATAEDQRHKAIAIAKMLSERMDFNLRVRDLWSDAAKEMAAFILHPSVIGEPVPLKCFVVDYKLGDEAVDTALFYYDTQQSEAQEFCKAVNEKGGAVNIKTRSIGTPAKAL